MSRVKTGVIRRRRHKKILKQTKGYYLTRSKLFKRAHEAFIKAGEYAFAGRKLKKRDFKSLWIVRLNAALRAQGETYSSFIKKIKVAKIELDRKVLSEIAARNPEVFNKIVEKVKAF
jgi:large subunit ribosomal protein L20